MSRFRRCASIVLLLLAGSSHAAEPNAPAATASTGLLLPVYAIDVPIDAAGAIDAKTWAELKSAGFNAVRFPVELGQGKAAVARVAALCAWAQSENVSLIPVLVASAGEPFGKKLDDGAEDFARGLAEMLRASDPGAYTRILMFQVGPELNHPACNGRLESKKAMAAALEAAKALRAAERKALEANGLSPTPLSISLSFDVPLLAAGAAPGQALAEAAYGPAYAALRQDIVSAAASNDVDIVTVTWFAGSLSAGGVERFATLLQAVAADAAGKQIVLATGVSTAFRAPAETEAFAKLAFANLAEHRTTGGADSPFIGLVFHRAVDTSAAQAAPAGFEEARAAWTPDELAAGVLSYWRGDKTSEAVAYWAFEVEARMGLLAADGATPALLGLRQVAGIVTDPAMTKAVAHAIARPTATPTALPSGAPEATPPPNATPGAGNGTAIASTEPPAAEDPNAMPNPFKDKVEAAALAVVDQLLARLLGETNEKLGGAPAGDGPGGGSTAVASISVLGASCVPSSVKVQQKVTCQVKLRNDSAGVDAAGLSIALLDASDYMLGDEAMVEGVKVPRSAQAMVPVTWHPTATGTHPVQVKVYDGSYAEVAAASAGKVTVKSGSSNKPSKPPGIGVLKPGFPWIGALALVGGPMKTMSGDGSSFTLPVANTSMRGMPPMTAALYVDGKPAATRALPALLPGQSRQIVFDGVRVTSSGAHELRVMLERPGTAPLAAGTLRVDGPALAAAQKRVPVRTSSVRPIRESGRTDARTTLRPPARPTPGIGRHGLATPVPVTPAGHADLGFLGDARVSPPAAKAGQAVSVQASIVNRGTKASGNITVAFELQDSRGRVGARGSRRLAPLAGRSQTSTEWTFTLPSRGPWRVDVRIQAAGDVSAGNNSTSASIRSLTVRPPLRRR